MVFLVEGDPQEMILRFVEFTSMGEVVLRFLLEKVFCDDRWDLLKTLFEVPKQTYWNVRHMPSPKICSSGCACNTPQTCFWVRNFVQTWIFLGVRFPSKNGFVGVQFRSKMSFWVCIISLKIVFSDEVKN